MKTVTTDRDPNYVQCQVKGSRKILTFHKDYIERVGMALTINGSSPKIDDPVSEASLDRLCGKGQCWDNITVTKIIWCSPEFAKDIKNEISNFYKLEMAKLEKQKVNFSKTYFQAVELLGNYVP